MAYSNQLNTAYRWSNIVTKSGFSHSISVYMCFLPFEPILLIVYPPFQLFKTLSLDESRSPEYNLFSDLEENSEEEVAETMAETMEQYMSKTRADYGSGIARPKINDKDHFELKAQINNLGREINKVNEKVYAAQVGCEQCKGPYYTKDYPLKEEAKRHEENSNLIKEIRASTNAAIRNQGASIKTLEIQIGQMSKSISTTIEADITPIRRIRSSQYAVLAQQNNKVMFESRRMTILFLSRLNDYYYYEKKGSYGPQFLEANSYGALHIDNSIPRKEKDPGSFTLPFYINNVCFDNALADLGASISVMPLSTYLNLGLGELAHTKLMVELADETVKYPKGIAENVLVGIGKFVFLVDFIILDMHKDVKVPLILGRPFLSTANAKIDVFKRKITLRVGDDKIIFKSMKPASSLIKRVYMLSLRERMELHLEARLMGETLVLNRSLDPLYGDYIELNDLNIPLELRRDQVDDLMPTIEEGKVIDKPMINIIKTRNNESFDEYPSFCDFDRKIHIDCAYNLRFSCMIRFQHVNANFFQLLSINVIFIEFYNSIIKDKVEYEGKNAVGAFMNVPIFVGNFFVVTHFVVVQNMDGYRCNTPKNVSHRNNLVDFLEIDITFVP
ncbi:retrovirus-related pol polyprotein from transposon TNT 1-94 [Tanacetum coccineum]